MTMIFSKVVQQSSLRQSARIFGFSNLVSDSRGYSVVLTMPTRNKIRKLIPKFVWENRCLYSICLITKSATIPDWATKTLVLNIERVLCRKMEQLKQNVNCNNWNNFLTHFVTTSFTRNVTTQNNSCQSNYTTYWWHFLKLNWKVALL